MNFDRYVILQDENFLSLMGRVNAIAKFPETDEGWRTGDPPRYNLVQVLWGCLPDSEKAFANKELGGYVAIVEKL